MPPSMLSSGPPFLGSGHVRAGTSTAPGPKVTRGSPTAGARGRNSGGLLALAARDGRGHSDAMPVDEGLELLTEHDARALLASGEIGRVGITIGALPAIFPVNYRVIDGAIVFRTAPGSKLSAAAEGAVVA